MSKPMSLSGLLEENERLKADQIALELRGRVEALEEENEQLKAEREQLGIRVEALETWARDVTRLGNLSMPLFERARELGVSESEPSRLMQCPTCGHQETTTHVGAIQCGPHDCAPACDMREVAGSDDWGVGDE